MPQEKEINTQKNKKEESSMKWGNLSLKEMEEMKAKMDRAWHELFEENHGKQDWIEQWFERLPICEGTKRSFQSRARKARSSVSLLSGVQQLPSSSPPDVPLEQGFMRGSRLV